MEEKKSAPKRPVASSVVTRVMRGTRSWSQDVFKLKVASRLFNMAWKTYRPQLIEQEHCHFYRSVNDQGVTNEYSTAIGGHFHKIEVEWNPDGTLKRTFCGPPLHKAQVTMPGSKRKVTRITQIYFEKETENGEVVRIEDNHSHEMDYIHTDEISPQKREAMRGEESVKVKSLMGEQAVKNYTAAAKPNPQASNLIVED